MEANPNSNRFTKEQKIGLVLLSSFVILAATLGVLQIRNTMYKPFALNNSIPAFIGEDVNTPDALRYRDTDLDGINDFDELYVYTTSPYLADSDSDGINDKQEIEKGTNPNCAEGKDCAGDVTADASAVLPKADNVALYDQQAPQTVEEYLSNPTRLREIMLTSGLSEDVLNKISDADLMKWAQEAFSSSTLTGNVNTSTVNTSATVQYVNQVMGNKK